MKIAGFALIGLMAVGVSPRLTAAQDFKGSGSDATRPFPLAAGLAVFETRHKGEGRFHVRLLDEQGAEIGAVADATGMYGGAKALQIPRTGLYVLDVSSHGEWAVKLRTNEPVTTNGSDPELAAGGRDGEAAGGEPGTAGTFGISMAASALTGPLGTLLVLNRAGAGAESAGRNAAEALGIDRSPGYVAGYRESFTQRLRDRRQRAALIGGVLGNAIFAFALFQLLDIGSSSNTPDPDPDPTPAIIVPIRF